MIISFGYKNGTLQRAGKIFDVRDLTHDEKSPEFAAKEQEITSYAKAHPSDTIAIGCERGMHRSRVLANRVATSARTSVLHRDK